MPPSGMSYEERMRHRAKFYDNHRNVKKPSQDSENFFNFEYSADRMKQISPYAVTIFLFTILFGVYALICNISSHVSSTYLDLSQRSEGVIEIPKGNKLYEFDVVQSLEGIGTPLYSELEIELLDENHKHLYSVYKDLWMESHPNGDGGSSVYSDIKMNFDIEISKKGTYYIRAIAHNGNLSPVQITTEKRTLGGGLYFFFYAIVFLVLSVILYLGKGYWGTPMKLLEACPGFSELKANKTFLMVFFSVLSVFILCVVIGVTHYGYASCGEETVLPTKFLGTDKLIYLG